MSDPNPYAPPNNRPLSNGWLPAEKYAVDTSLIRLREYQRLLGSVPTGVLVWLQSRRWWSRWKTQVIDGPMPFLDCLCDFSEIADALKPTLEEAIADAQQNAFDQCVYSTMQSTGVVVDSAAVRMMHRSGEYVLQILVAKCDALIKSELQVVTSGPLNAEVAIEQPSPFATAEHVGLSQPFTSYATSNDKQFYDLSPGCRARYFPDATLSQLLSQHVSWMETLDSPRSKITTLDELALMQDHLTTRYYQFQVERGILVPQPPLNRNSSVSGDA